VNQNNVEKKKKASLLQSGLTGRISTCAVYNVDMLVTRVSLDDLNGLWLLTSGSRRLAEIGRLAPSLHIAH
jgi:hypothetical protein